MFLVHCAMPTSATITPPETNLGIHPGIDQRLGIPPEINQDANAASTSVSDCAWGVLRAVSEIARQRPQGPNIFFTHDKHVLGRNVENPHFLLNIFSAASSQHCTISRRRVDGNQFAVFLQDHSTNGTYVNGQYHRGGKEQQLKHGDLISIRYDGSHSLDFVYEDILKRKAAWEENQNTSKRLMADLGDVRRLEHKNQELRRLLEEECNKTYKLHADLAAATTKAAESLEEVRRDCEAEFSRRLQVLEAELHEKERQLEERNSELAAQRSTIEVLEARLKAATQSRQELEEALLRHKDDRERLEKQLEEDRNSRMREHLEIENRHKAALDKARADREESSRVNLEAASSQHKQLENRIKALETAKRKDQEQYDDFLARLQTERDLRTKSESQAQELQMQLAGERTISTMLRQELDRTNEQLYKVHEELQIVKGAWDAEKTRMESLMLESSRLESEMEAVRRRLQGASDKITLRETQLRSFHATGEEIKALQIKQHQQLKVMMETLMSDLAEENDEAHSAGTQQNNIQDNEENSEAKTEELVDNANRRSGDDLVQPSPEATVNYIQQLELRDEANVHNIERQVNVGNEENNREANTENLLPFEQLSPMQTANLLASEVLPSQDTPTDIERPVSSLLRHPPRPRQDLSSDGRSPFVQRNEQGYSRITVQVSTEHGQSQVGNSDTQPGGPHPLDEKFAQSQTAVTALLAGIQYFSGS